MGPAEDPNLVLEFEYEFVAYMKVLNSLLTTIQLLNFFSPNICVNAVSNAFSDDLTETLPMPYILLIFYSLCRLKMSLLTSVIL